MKYRIINLILLVTLYNAVNEWKYANYIGYCIYGIMAIFIWVNKINAKLKKIRPKLKLNE